MANAAAVAGATRIANACGRIAVRRAGGVSTAAATAAATKKVIAPAVQVVRRANIVTPTPASAMIYALSVKNVWKATAYHVRLWGKFVVMAGVKNHVKKKTMKRCVAQQIIKSI